MTSAIKAFAAKLATNGGLNTAQAGALDALAARLAGVDALEARRMVSTFMDDATLRDMGIDDPKVAVLARQLVTARTMEHDGESLDDVAGADPYASTRELIKSLGDSDDAKRLQAGLDAAIAEDKAES